MARPRWATARRLDRPTFGAAAATAAKAVLGVDLLPWQRMVLDTALEVNEDTGRFSYRTVVVSVPRQNGKSALLQCLRVWRCLAWPDQMVAATAQKRNDARDRWVELAQKIERGPAAHLMHRRAATGNEALEWSNGSVDRIVSPTESAGHGLTVDLAVIDEAWAVAPHVIGTLTPAQIAVERPQLWAISTAGTAASHLLHEMVQTGREAVTDPGSTVAYFEWSAADDDDPHDPDVWHRCMPALGSTVALEGIEHAHATSSPGDWERFYLNRWTKTDEAVIPATWWNRAVRAGSAIGGPIHLAVDVAYGREASAIAAAGQSTGKAGAVHAEVIDHEPGTDWLAARVVALARKHRVASVAIDPAGPAGSIVDALVAHLGPQLEVIDARRQAQACSLLFDATRDGTLTTIEQPAVLDALAGAKRRPLGDSWAWGRKTSATDISPLVALTLAHRQAVHADEMPAPSIR